MTKPDNKTEHGVLPPDAQAMLKRAAATRIPDHDPLARQKALDRAMGLIRREYPQFFNKEQ